MIVYKNKHDAITHRSSSSGVRDQTTHNNNVINQQNNFKKKLTKENISFLQSLGFKVKCPHQF